MARMVKDVEPLVFRGVVEGTKAIYLKSQILGV